MANLTEEELSILKESGFWDFVSADVSLYRLDIIDRDEFNKSIKIAADLYKKKIKSDIYSNIKERLLNNGKVKI